MYILALDQGTSSSRALLFDRKGEVAGLAQQEFTQHYPQPGWVEHDPEEIWESQKETVRQVMNQVGASPEQIQAIGITNQRETTILWDKTSGQPVHPAIVWQDRRTSSLCKEWKEKHGAEITSKTGLIVDAYFSGSKIAWLLDSIGGLRERAEKGEIAFGTVDSWLIWKLTGGKRHVTDTSNASRTMLFNIETLQWDDELLRKLNIPPSILPQVVESSGVVGETTCFGAAIPIAGIAGDQQSALFGQRCFQSGLSKNTYGTGCFMLLNTGSERRHSNNQLLSTVAWTIAGKTTYALEGSVFIGGAAVGWLRDGLEIIEESSQVEQLAQTVENNGDVYFVPAFNGLGTPYWDQDARGVMIGLTRGTTRGHIARATLESIAFQVSDLMDAMQKDSGLELKELRVDGGASANQLLMQFQADLLQAPVVRPKNTETTALGAALLAGLAVDFFPSIDDLAREQSPDQVFRPALEAVEVERLKRRWGKAVERCRNWAEG